MLLQLLPALLPVLQLLLLQLLLLQLVLLPQGRVMSTLPPQKPALTLFSCAQISRPLLLAPAPFLLQILAGAELPQRNPWRIEAPL